MAKRSLTDYPFLKSRIKSKAIRSSGKIRPVLPIFVQQEMLQRHNSMDNMSIGDVSDVLNEKSSSNTKADNSLQSSPSPFIFGFIFGFQYRISFASTHTPGLRY